ncbi:unnamed protein product [Phytophthora lilii]|uniref:Unnamed protein product n=1 Tax=Phytophthora lilii TaxID=2077276 RepID=A0A9W6WYJ0_9STRA|nr:unnamed protein product [Phytophthora lilii]
MMSISLGAGIDLEVEVALDILKKLTLKSHGSTVEIGATSEIEGLSAGYLNSVNFYDLDMTSHVSKDMAQSGIDIDLEVDAIPTVRASVSLLGGTALIGVRPSFAVFVQLEAGVQFPDPYPGLSSRYLLAQTSYFHGGDCSKPHFMEYNAYAGYGDVYVTLPTSLSIPYVITKTSEPVLVSSSSRIRTSLFSGYVTSVYDAQIMLSAALNAISSLSEENRKC